MRFPLNLGRTSLRSFRLESIKRSRIRSGSILIGVGFDAVIWTASLITSCTTFAKILFAFGCYGTTVGTPILDWNASLNSGLEPGCFSGRADRPLFRIQNHRGRATEQQAFRDVPCARYTHHKRLTLWSSL